MATIVAGDHTKGRYPDWSHTGKCRGVAVCMMGGRGDHSGYSLENIYCDAVTFRVVLEVGKTETIFLPVLLYRTVLKSMTSCIFRPILLLKVLKNGLGSYTN